MTASEQASRALTLQSLPELRRRTEAVSQFLQEQLLAHLETLKPLLLPERLLGRFATSTVAKGADPAVADRAFAQLQQAYRPFVARPFDLPSEFDQYWLTLVGHRLTLYPWEYIHQVKDERETKAIRMSSPVRWVVSFSSAYTLSQMRQALTDQGERRPEHIRQFVVNALVMQHIINQTPGLTSLFADLRYRLQTDFASDLPKLPLTTITSGLPSFRPSDDLILAATNFSGVPAFIELIDVDALVGLEDPLRARIEQLVR